MSKFLSDLRHGWRSLRHGRGVTVLAVVAFGLGIGITTAVFSLFYAVLLKPLPYPNPDALVIVYDTQPACTTCPASYPKYIDWTTRNHVFSVMGGSSSFPMVVTGVGEPERLQASRATHTLLDVFGVAPATGRWFSEAEDQPNGPKVVVLSDGYWTRRFGADPHVLGKTMTIDGDVHEVIGVMPPEFSHRRAEFFVPVQRANDPATRGNHFLATYARLKPGVTLARAQNEMRALGSTLAKEFGHNHGIDVESYFQVVVGNVVQPLRVLMGAVCLVLLVACANVANLLLASGVARRREFAVRSALGATRMDLARQLTIESVMLAIAGAVLGVFLAEWAVTVFVHLAGTILPRATTVKIDGVVLAFVALLAIITGVVCGLWPVMHLGARTLAQGMREGDIRTGSDASGRRFGNGLVVAEIALAFSLLVGAGLLVKNLIGLEGRETGFVEDNVVTFDLAPNGPRYKDPEPLRAFYRDLLPRLSTVSGVERVAATSHLPMYNFGWNGEVTLDHGNPWQPKDAPLVEFRWIGGDYFGAMGIPVVRGRAFDDRDRVGATPVCIISKRAADVFWPGEDPIGRHVAKGGPASPTLEVVGVAHDVRSFGLQTTSPYELYVPIEQVPFAAMTIVLRMKGSDPTSVIPAVRRIVGAIDPLLPLAKVQTMTDVVGQSVNQPRLLSSLTALFGALAGLLAAVGVYGVTAYNVRRERREFGIRLALGAEPRAVRRLVVRRGLLLGGLGVAIGGVGALLLTRTLASMLTDVRPADPLVFGVAALGLLAVSFVAVYLPAFQASRTNPLVVLRSE